MNYSSNGANSLLGQGWSIGGLSSITRCSSNKVIDDKNRAVAYDIKDNFCLDGQRLVSIGSNEYRTHIENYSKIKRYGSVDNPNGFSVKTKSGETFNYGDDDYSSTYETINGKNSVWYVTEIHDGHGSFIDFKYEKKDGITRVRDIYYSNGRITFRYGDDKEEDRTDREYGYQSGNLKGLRTQLDTIEIKSKTGEFLYRYKLKYHSQQKRKERLKLKSIEKCMSYSECSKPLTFNWQGQNDGNPTFTRSYSFPNIDTNENNTKLADFNGDGYNDIYLVKSGKDEVWINQKSGNFSKKSTLQAEGDGVNIFPMDIDADGDIDIFEVTNNTINAWLNNGKGSFSKQTSNIRIKGKLKFDDADEDGDIDIFSAYKSNQHYTKLVFIQNNGNGTFSEHTIVNKAWLDDVQIQAITDVDDDGDKDILFSYVWNDYATSKYPRIGIIKKEGVNYRFDTNKRWHAGQALSRNYHGGDRVVSHDFNNDGTVDLLLLSDLKSFPSKIFYANKKGQFYGKEITGLSNSIGSARIRKTDKLQEVQVIDMNSDGLADLYIAGSGKHELWLNKGDNTFNKNTIGISETKLKDLRFGDFKGNGLVDIYQLNTKGNDSIWMNDNGLLSFSTNRNTPNLTKDVLLADMNGDGMVDIVHAKKNSKIYTNKNKPAVITSIIDSFGNKTTIEYKPLTDNTVYSKSENKTQGKINLSNASLVVAAISSSDGVGGKNKTTYHYKNLLYDLKKGLLGYKTITTTEEKTQIKNETEYYQEYPLVGHVKSIRTLIDNEEKASSHFSIKAIKKDKQYHIQTQSTKETDYLSGITTTNSYSNYDNYGNVKNLVSTTSTDGETFRKTTTSTYLNDTSNWILGRLKTASVKHEGSGDSITRKSSFTYDSKGRVEKEIREPGHELALTTSYTYDRKSNVKTKTISGASLKEDRVTTYHYDHNGKHLLRTTNPMGHSNKANNQYNALGQLTKTTDANGFVTNFEYNKWGQKTKTIHHDGTVTTHSYKFDTSIDDAKYSITTKSTGSPAKTTFYDSFDRVIRVKTQRFDGKSVYVETHYNEKSEVEKKSLPYVSGETKVYMEYSYDEYGRLVETRKPSPAGGDAVESVKYDGLTVTTTDAKGHVKTVTKNALEQTVEVTEEEGTKVTYIYDAVGNLKETISNDDETMKIIMNYDILGNKKNMTDPDMGYWKYTYDALGQLISQTDAKKQTTTIEYDKLGRKVKETSEDGENSWVYDQGSFALGKLSSESSTNSTKKYSYDAQGRISTVVSKIEDKSFTQNYSYNTHGKLATTTQPNGLKLINTYNAQGFLESIKSPAQQIDDFDRDHFTELLEKTMANGLEYYKKSLEFQDKAKKLRSKAAYYAAIAKRYAKYEKIYKDYAKRLRGYAKRYEYYGKRYASYSQRYRSYANYYYNRANYYYSRYGRYWWGQWVGSWFKRLASRYSYYAGRYAYYSRYYLNRARSYNNWADRYDYYGSYFGRVEDFYLKRSKALYTEAASLEKKAKEYQQLAARSSNTSNEEVTEAYKEILADAEYVYHYKVLEQNSLGKVTKYLSGNGLVTEDTYDETGAMNNSKTGYTFDGAIRDLSYKYDHNYNVTSRADHKLGISQTFGYDKLDRIVSARVNSKKYGFSNDVYAYDVYGNLRQKGGKTLEYDNGNHQVSSVGSTKYLYDKNGNMYKNGDISIEYNAHNKVTKIRENGKNILFAYDMNQNRYKKSSGMTDTYYVGKTYEYQTHTNGSKTHKYMIYAHGKVVTVHSEKTEVQASGEKLTFDETRYLHYDSLGSVDAITNQQGTVVQRTAYKPFGEKIEIQKLSKGKEVTNRGYTGHEHIEGSKFIHMNARLYDPTIGRFLSADTFIQAPHDTQSYNRYSYVKNNPLRYTDPTGHFFSGVKSWIKKNWRAIVTTVAVIAVGVLTGGAGFLGIAGLGWTSSVAIGAAMGFTGGFVGTLVNGGSFGQALRNGAIGGITGAVTAGFTQGIGDLGAWMTSAGNYSAGTAFATKTVLHGALSGFMSAARGGKWSAGFYAGAVGTMLSPFARTGNYYGNVASNAIISGTVSALSGGKFANGAIMGAFRYMFNDALASHATTKEERQEYLLKRAKKWSESPYIIEKYKTKLDGLIADKNIKYTHNEYSKIVDKIGQQHVFGLSAKDFSYIKITGKAWSVFQDNSFMIQVQVDKTMLHEIKHLLIANNNHPVGFEDEVHDMMEQMYPNYIRP